MFQLRPVYAGRLYAVVAVAVTSGLPFILFCRLMAQEAAQIGATDPNAAAASAETDQDGLMVAGTVVDEQGKSVGGATVSGLSFGEFRLNVKTNQAGEFKLKRARSRFVPEMVRAIDKDGRQGISSWNHRSAFQITLKPPRELTVNVVNGDGAAINGAAVVVQTGQMVVVALASGETDAAGRFTCKIPVDAVVEQVAALKRGVGFDHFSTLTELQGVNRRPLPKSVELKLDGTRNVLVKAVDSNGQPLQGVKVTPFRLLKHEQADRVQVSEWEAASSVTDATGIAVVDWLPANGPTSISFMGSVPGYRSVRRFVGMGGGNSAADVTIPFVRLSRIMGRVTFADGRPAGNIQIVARGFGRNGSRGGRAYSRADGSYEISANPGVAYVAHVEDSRWAAPFQVGVVVPEGEDVTDRDFTLAEGTIVRGRVTVGPDQRPVPNYDLDMMINTGAVPEPFWPRGGMIQQMGAAYSAVTSADGSYRFCLPPGTYEFGGGGGILAPLKLDVVEGQEVAHDVHVPRIPQDPANTRTIGTVVDAEKRPVDGALISGTARSPVFRFLGRTISRMDGRFEFVSTLVPLVVHARTENGTIAGISRIDRADQPPVICLDRAATAHGRLLNDEGQIADDRRLRYGITVREEDKDPTSAGQTLAVDIVTTNANGRFELRGLVPGEEFVLEYEPEFKSDRWRRLTTLKATMPGPLDLGDLRLPAPE